MAVTFHSIKCPDCGASLHIEEGRAQIFCAFCGEKVVAAGKTAPADRPVAEAECRQAEAPAVPSRTDAAEAERTPEETAKRRVIIGIALVLAAILLIVVIRSAIKALKLPGILLIAAVVCAVVILWKKKGAKADGDTRIKVPSAVSDYERKNYATVEAVFKSAGFTNVQCVPLNDLTFGLLKKPNMVASITVNGSEITSGGRKFAPDAPVVICYHSFAGR